jgi:flagellar protein FliO/FliZ
MIPSLSSFLLAGTTLIAVLALILLAGRLVRAGGLAPRSGVSRQIRVCETIALDQRRRLHLVSCDGRRLLLLTGGASDTIVGWLPPASPDKAP